MLRILLGNPSVVRVLLPCVSAGFFPLVVTACLRFSLVPRTAFPPFVAVLFVLVVVFFAPALVLSPPVLPCSVAVASGCLFSDSFESPVPVAT